MHFDFLRRLKPKKLKNKVGFGKINYPYGLCLTASGARRLRLPRTPIWPNQKSSYRDH